MTEGQVVTVRFVVDTAESLNARELVRDALDPVFDWVEIRTVTIEHETKPCQIDENGDPI